MMKVKFLLSTLFFCTVLSVTAQTVTDRIHVGVKGGINMSRADYSSLKNRSPKFMPNALGGIFIEFEFGENHLFSIRPEVNFLGRGTKISENDLNYKLNAKYTDVRLPLIFNFGNPDKIRPYIYVAPIAGFVRGGKISLKDATGSYKINVASANMADTYFAGALGIGFKLPIYLSENKRMHFSLEANYQMCFTDTYGKMEKDGDAFAVNRPAYYLRGERKLHGFEVAATLSLPLSIFKRAPKKKAEPVYIPQPIQIVQDTPVVREEVKPCYSLEEILDLIAKNKSVVGKTICAIDMVHFEFDKSVIKENSYPYLNKITDLIKKTSMHITIKGHTDGIGKADYNMELSKKRAQSVYNYLVGKGVDPSCLKYEYYGLTRPIAPNATEEGRLMNRRVEFEITE
ncbi:OmpA family protein [Parabacteroides sp. GYB001]|uniref:OmpA family protein n=1 Tax=Parabacteroides leei TaxID=2939491 RepID=UPI002017D44B|nr:OmpA family protein [Parabacteroides leei]MCL3853083.1 OmpA family protein [Parabacteroides leei]